MTLQSRQPLVLGTRASKLALQQSRWVAEQVMNLNPGLRVELKEIRTSGDKILDVPLAKIGGKGLFVKEIEDALLARDIDFAVHSMKDVPTQLPDGLDIVCVPPREDPRDALIAREVKRFEDLPCGATIGTSSLRRQAQLLHHRPDLVVEMLRGNLDTRLRKLREGLYDAIVLAAAGLKRLGWQEQVTQYLPVEISLPAIGQGALGIEARRDDAFVVSILARLEDAAARSAVTAERALLHRLEGGCQVPIAGHASLQGDRLRLAALVGRVDGSRLVHDQLEGPLSDASRIGAELAERLLRQGAREILDQIYGRT
ncbi:hydroxymethylbilane synthase [Nitrospira tepida]|uniref:Porphobilinogen deaminase n=1 Tax=Nitrospira tepida TaxID=2973512 RepID=A0AA86TCS6_9BACT|nr:hydroxymethylbilane synthase [Nitrospira tepida]CAI4032239.1 hydroxymethylbilane synthase [Nitrospira tepida]